LKIILVLDKEPSECDDEKEAEYDPILALMIT